MTKYIDLVVDLNFGSTGKGLLCGWLAKRGMHDTVMTSQGPNSGHTYIDSDGRKFVHLMMPIGVVGPHVKRIMFGPGAILDLDILLREIESCRDIIEARNIEIFIHPNAAVVTQANRDAEQGPMTTIGSTKKGVGEALIQKIRRDPAVMATAAHWESVDNPIAHAVFNLGCVHLIQSPINWLDVYNQSNIILIEGAQGFGLSIQHGFYPYVTSRDVTPSQILADCGVPFVDSREVCVWGTARTYPIRVANRFDEDGKQVGYSGPGFPDQIEMQWSEIGYEPELTTVTKLPRRLFSFSEQQMAFAKGICSPNVIFLNFVNYLKSYDQFKEIYGFLVADGTEVIVGIGPTVDDVISGLPTDPYDAWMKIILKTEHGRI